MTEVSLDLQDPLVPAVSLALLELVVSLAPVAALGPLEHPGDVVLMGQTESTERTAALELMAREAAMVKGEPVVEPVYPASRVNAVCVVLLGFTVSEVPGASSDFPEPLVREDPEAHVVPEDGEVAGEAPSSSGVPVTVSPDLLPDPSRSRAVTSFVSRNKFVT